MFTDHDDIERELKASLGVQPSSGFERRVLEAAAGQAGTRRVPWTWLGVAAALVLAAGVWALSGGTTQPSPQSVVTQVGAPTIVEPSRPTSGPRNDPPDMRARAAASTRPTTGAARRVDSMRPREPEVLVPADQLALITAFAREIQGGRVHLAEDADAQARLRTLIVPEMTVQPIAIATLEAGVNEPGSKGLHQ